MSSSSSSNEASKSEFATSESQSTDNEPGPDESKSKEIGSDHVIDHHHYQDMSNAALWMQRGTCLLRSLGFLNAVDLFKSALDVLVKIHGESAPECIQAYYKYGLTLMYIAAEPLPDDDLMAILPVETDYGLQLGIDRFMATENQIRDRVERQIIRGVDKWIEPSKYLEAALSIIGKQPSDSIEKVEILSALGELIYRLGKVISIPSENLFERSQNYYRRALSIMEILRPEQDDLRIADLNLKICACLVNRGEFKESKSYYNKGVSVCDTVMYKLRDDMDRHKESEAKKVSSGLNQEPSTGRGVDPYTLKKIYVITSISEFCRKFTHYYDNRLMGVVTNSNSTASSNQIYKPYWDPLTKEG